jgi:hypothetical protein
LFRSGRMSPSTRTPRWSESPFTPGTSQVTIDDVGTYRVQFVISGIEANQFALFHNGTAIPGSVYGSGSGTGETGDVIIPLAAGDVIIPLAAGDVITVRNHTSAGAVTLQTLAGGTQTNVNASLMIERLPDAPG